jgi:dienelactone hydrolase
MLSALGAPKAPDSCNRASINGGLMNRLLQLVALVLLLPNCVTAASDEKHDNGPDPQLREEIWAIPSTLPMLAYMVRPAGNGPFPLLVMNHGVSLDPKERSYFPVIEFRDAAVWFARQGYVVVAPVRPGYGATAIEKPERGLFGLFFSGVGNCSDANFRDAGLAIASIDMWVIDYMSVQPFIKHDDVIVVGQSGGGWGAIALGSQNPKTVRAIIGFEAGRGGHFNGKPNNNCAPDRLVEAVAQFGRTARIPMLWIYTHNDSYFGPDLSKRLAAAFQAAGGNLEYHLLPDFGADGHFLIDSADAVPIWAPPVSEFLKNHP